MDSWSVTVSSSSDGMSDEPLISCLCISRKRPHLLEKAMQCFLAQTYANKELVVIHPASDTATRECIENARCESIHSCAVDQPGATLGDLRNISIERAAGALCCVWDDDDWHSPNRLSAQCSALQASKKHAVILSRLLVHDSRTARAYLGYERLWENTTLFAKDKIIELGLRYPSLNRFEDYEFVNSLVRHNLVYPLLDPTLYVYQVNGSNTSGGEHFDALIKRCAPLSTEQSDVVKSCVDFTTPPLLAHEAMQAESFRSSFCYVRSSAVPRA